MSTLFAVDDGIASGHFNWADVFFLIGTVIAVLAALAYAPSKGEPPPWSRWAGVLVALAVGTIAFGLFLL